MPIIGLGTWKSEPSRVGDAVAYALTESGYRHIDCAWIYGNEPEIGASLKNVFSATVQRDTVFITSKLWNSFHRRKDVMPACKETLRNLHLDYLDLYLMHWGLATPKGETEPVDENGMTKLDHVPIQETWEAMQELVKEGLVRAIGISNFTVPMIVDLLSYAKIPPAVNQVELHGYLQQQRLVEFCEVHGIVPEAYSPLGRPGAEPARVFLKAPTQRLIDDATIVEIARTHTKTPSQILIRWAIERGCVVIPKSVTPSRIQENIAVFDFTLTEEDMHAIEKLERNARIVDPYAWGKIPYFN